MSAALTGIVTEIRTLELRIAEERKLLEGLEDREAAGAARCRIRATELLIAKLRSVSAEIAVAQQDAQKAEQTFAAWRAIVAEIRAAEDQRDKLTRDLASVDEEVRKLQAAVRSAIAHSQQHADVAPSEDDFALLHEVELHRERATQLEKEKNQATQKLKDASTRQAQLQVGLLGAKKRIGDLVWREARLRPSTPEHGSTSIGVLQSVR